MEKNLKPIKCWDCMYLASCMRYNKNGCDKFEKFAVTLLEVSQMTKIDYKELLSLKRRKGAELMIKHVNEIAKPLKFKCEKLEGKYVYERVR